MLSTLRDEKKDKTENQPLLTFKNEKTNSVTEYTHTFVGFIHFCTCAYCMMGTGL